MSEPDEKTCKVCKLGPPDWKYVCKACGHEFTMPAAKGPTEEKSRACPECGSGDIERVGITKGEACAPGG